MRTIKRYANRKLYDTSLRRYVNLVEITQLVQKGTEVRVVDSRTGEDITKLTLSQILLEKEKRKQGLVPKTMFTDLIRKGSSQVMDVLRRGVEGGKGVLHWFEGEVDRGVKKFIRAGKITDKEGRRLRDDLVARLTNGKSQLESLVDDQVHFVLHKVNIPTQKDIDQLTRKLERLASKVEALDRKSGRPAPARPAASGKRSGHSAGTAKPAKAAAARKPAKPARKPAPRRPSRAAADARPIKVETVRVKTQAPGALQAPAQGQV